MIQTWGIGLDGARDKAKKIYKKIGTIPCPFFSDESVSFTSRRFEHILRDKGKRLRPVSQRLIRLRLIEYVEAIIKNEDGKVHVEFRDEYEIERYVNRHGEKILEKKKARFWAFYADIGGCKIKVVIGQIEGGKKEFLSVMTNKFEIHQDDKTQTKNPA